MSQLPKAHGGKKNYKMQSLLLLFWFENKAYQISFPAISLNQFYHLKTRTSGEGCGNPLRYSCLEYPMDRGAWWATVHGVAKSRTWLSAHSHIYCLVSVHHFLGGGGLVAKSCLTFEPHGLQSTRLLCPWDIPGKNTGVGCHFLLQGIFLTQKLKPYLLLLLHWQADSLPLHYVGRWDHDWIT